MRGGVEPKSRTSRRPAQTAGLRAFPPGQVARAGLAVAPARTRYLTVASARCQKQRRSGFSPPTTRSPSWTPSSCCCRTRAMTSPRHGRPASRSNASSHRLRRRDPRPELHARHDVRPGGIRPARADQGRSIRPCRCWSSPAWSSVAGAVEAMRRGARDYIEKPWDDEQAAGGGPDAARPPAGAPAEPAAAGGERAAAAPRPADFIAEAPGHPRGARDDRARGAVGCGGAHHRRARHRARRSWPACCTASSERAEQGRS